MGIILFILLLLITILLLFPFAAPTLGPGASGTITLTVGFGGNSPPTGYPLHNIVSHLVNLIFPFGETAYRMNLISVFFTALTITLLTGAALEAKKAILQDHEKIKQREAGLAWIAIFSAVVYSESIARITYFGDRYSLACAVAMACIYNFLNTLNRYSRNQDSLQKNLHLGLMLFGFCFCAHFTMAPLGLIALLGIYFFIFKSKTKIKIPWIATYSLVGFLPFLFLVLNAQMKPLFNWGNPDTLKRLYHYVLRSEYGSLSLQRNWSIFLENSIEFFRIFALQFSWIHLAGILGLLFYLLIRKRIFLLGISLIGFFFTGFLTRIIWYWHDDKADPIYTDLNLELIGKYFAPVYFFGSLLFAISILLLFRKIEQWKPKALQPALFGIIILLSALSTGPSMYHAQGTYDVTREIAKNIEILTEPNSLILTDFDTCFSSMTYHQLERGQLKDRVIIHTNLLYRSWYVDSLKQMYPNFYATYSSEFIRLKILFEKVEAMDQSAQEGAIALHKTILAGMAKDYSKKGGTYTCPEAFYGNDLNWKSSGFVVEPYVFLSRLHTDSHAFEDLPIGSLSFSSLQREHFRSDAWSSGILRRAAHNLKARAKYVGLFEKEKADQLNGLSFKIDQWLSKRPPHF